MLVVILFVISLVFKNSSSVTRFSFGNWVVRKMLKCPSSVTK